MKGISTVLATLLMLIITIALAGVAYAYISGIFESKATRIINVVDASCRANTGFFLTVKNLDAFNAIDTNDIIVRVNDTTVTSGNIIWEPTNISANSGTSTATISCPVCASAGTAHGIRVIGPSNAEQATAFC